VDAALLTLPVLALADSTSVGTFVIPVLALLAPGPTPFRRLGAYLGVVAGLYFLIGLALLGMSDAAAAVVKSADDSVVGIVVEGVLGALLLGYAVWPKRKARRSGPSGISRWRQRALDPGAPMTPLLVLAVVAVGIEAVSMLPYIGAIALVARADLAWPASASILFVYCLIMILPAIALMLLRSAAAGRIQPVLERIERWSQGSAGSQVIVWAAGLVGVVLIADALLRAYG
jgi:hypothetical protein